MKGLKLYSKITEKKIGKNGHYKLPSLEEVGVISTLEDSIK